MLRAIVTAAFVLGGGALATWFYTRNRRRAREDEVTMANASRPDWETLHWTVETEADTPFCEEAWTVKSDADADGCTWHVVKLKNGSPAYVLIASENDLVKATFAFDNYESVRPRPPREPMSKLQIGGRGIPDAHVIPCGRNN